MDHLTAMYCRIRKASLRPGWQDHCGPAWRISSEDCSFALPFAREVDALMAMRALADAGITTMDEMEAFKAEHGREELVRICCSALQW